MQVRSIQDLDIFGMEKKTYAAPISKKSRSSNSID